MIGNKIRLLEASEIECRVGSIGKNGLSLLYIKMPVWIKRFWMSAFLHVDGNGRIRR